jgi:uncharacterized C2H2 Zn-finger protein
MSELENLRPKGTVAVPCSGRFCKCEDGGVWVFFVEALDPRLPDGPFLCPRCEHVLRCEKETGREVIRHSWQGRMEDDGLPTGTRYAYLFADTGERIPEMPNEKADS